MKKLDIIGISDHNSVENVVSVRRAGEKEGIVVMGGIEITSTEEVHTLAFFATDSDLEAIQDIIYKNLDGVNDERAFGEQVMFDTEGNVVGHNSHLLIGATRLLLQTVVETIHFLGGVAIASHVDRESFSIISQLGFIPAGLPLDALELSPFGSEEEFKAGFPLITFSDAHFLEDVGRVSTSFIMEEATVQEIRKALRREDGRFVSSYTGHS